MTILTERQHTGRRLLLPLVAMCLTLAATAEDLLQVDFTGGYGGTWQESRSLVPVYVTIKNRLQNLSGRIEIRHPSSTGIGTEVVRIKPFRSPNPSVRRFRILTRVQPGRGLEAKVVFDQKLPSESKAWHGGGSDHIVLDVGLPVVFKEARDEGGNFSAKHQLISYSPRDLPLQSLAYDGVYAVMTTGRYFQQLNRNQVEALRDWLYVGGRLFLLNPTPKNSRFAKNVLILAPDRIFSGKTGVMRLGAGLVAVQVQSTPKDLPFWAEEERQQERQWFLPDIPEGQPSDMPFANISPSETDSLFGRMTRTDSTYGFMGFIWLLLIIGTYIIVIGPLDYWLVKRTGKPWLTWIMFSTAIVGFSLLAYWYSGVVHSSRMQSIRVNIVDQIHGKNISYGNSIFWLYSTKNTSYKITPERPNVHLSGRESAVYSSVAWVRVYQNNTPGIEARIPIFSAKTFDATWQSTADWELQLLHRTGQERFILPKDLKIRTVFLADANGVASCKNFGENQWGAVAPPRSWDTELELAADFQAYAEALPDPKELEKYLFFCSFAETPVPPAYKEYLMKRAQRGMRETAFDVSEKIRTGGRILLVFLEPGDSLLPMQMNLVAPEAAEANLLRIHLPPAE